MTVFWNGGRTPLRFPEVWERRCRTWTGCMRRETETAGALALPLVHRCGAPGKGTGGAGGRANGGRSGGERLRPMFRAAGQLAGRHNFASIVLTPSLPQARGLPATLPR